MTDKNPSLFHEMYGRYYRVVARLIERANKSPLSGGDIADEVREHGFGETGAILVPMLTSREWPLFEKLGCGYIAKTKPCRRPLSLLEKRWLSAIANDERIRLFMDEESIVALKERLAVVEPLYNDGDFFIVDRDNNPDSFEDQSYLRNFRAVLFALRNRLTLQIEYKSPANGAVTRIAAPIKLQYSRKDDKFRLFCTVKKYSGAGRTKILNVSRMLSVKVREEKIGENLPLPVSKSKLAVVELSSERDTGERAMIHFADFECEAYIGDRSKKWLKIRYDSQDENELLIRILAFGPLITVHEPQSLVEAIKERVARQLRLFKELHPQDAGI